MTMSKVYLLFLCGNLHEFFLVTSATILVLAIITPFVLIAVHESIGRDFFYDRIMTKFKLIKYVVIFFIISILAIGLIPSRNQIAIIYLLPKITQSKIAKDIPIYVQEYLKLQIKKMEKDK